MPTWRPWEINAARDDFTETAYYKMVMKIYNSVPDDLKEKVIVLPHPLIANELRELNSPISDKLAMDARYDDILQQTRILITDYSSIAYDAFFTEVPESFSIGKKRIFVCRNTVRQQSLCLMKKMFTAIIFIIQSACSRL